MGQFEANQSDSRLGNGSGNGSVINGNLTFGMGSLAANQSDSSMGISISSGNGLGKALGNGLGKSFGNGLGNGSVIGGNLVSGRSML